MAVFLDTSVLVAAFWGDHPDHYASLRLLARLSKDSGACAAHSLAELYSVMTRLPVKPRILPEQAMLFVEEARSRLKVVALDESEYAKVLLFASTNGIGGGSIYDALILEYARKIRAETIYAWNVSDFRRIAPDLTSIIKTP